MTRLDKIAQKADVHERCRILEDCDFRMYDIAQTMLRFAEASGLSDKQIINILDYFNDFHRCFRELESYFFWLYDPNDLTHWHEALNHIYLRCITDVELMN